ncbi:hypothetical protein [Asanoa sp. NPDC050611]|uniref:hypothetical protein n=1 Tax=Asanoa sp. NPDC050611 TaxID=3157098 RepID=UPI0033E1ED2F
MSTVLPIASGRATARAFGRKLRRHPGLGLLAVLVSAAASGAAVLVPILLGRIVDLVIAHGGTRELLGIAAWTLAAGLVGRPLPRGARAAVVVRAGRALAGDAALRAGDVLVVVGDRAAVDALAHAIGP